ncbi:hypothetical protein ACHWQZ_G016484 [Mnemiopsis leidyi]
MVDNMKSVVLWLILASPLADGLSPRELGRRMAEITPTNVTIGAMPNDQHKAAHAIDRDLSTLVATFTEDGKGWIKFEYAKTYFIHNVIIYYWFYTNWIDPNAHCVQSIAFFMGCVDNDNNVDVSVYQGEVKQKSCGTLQLTYGLEQSDQIYTLLCNTGGDTVLFSKNTGIIAFFEVVVTSTDRDWIIAEITPSTVTQGQTLFNDELAFAAKHAIDKDLMTNAASSTGNGAGWLKLEFNRIYAINKIIIFSRFYNNWYRVELCTQNEANFKLCVDISTNTDVSVYQGDVKQKSCGALQLTYGLEQSDQIYTLLCNTEGDTVKLTKNTGHLSVHEIAVITTGILL